MNYYNEHDPKAAAWLRELITQGHIPAGDVDTRSITEVSPDEIAHYTQCHFFAGIGGWSLALELAGWPPSRPVWTGSCPCQPFSTAGQGKGGCDDRHLWPVFRGLIAKLNPERVFGEQVAQAIGFNWLDGISADLEADGYTVGAVVLGAHSVGAPHIRQRLYWVADTQRSERRKILTKHERNGYAEREKEAGRPATRSASLRIANANSGRLQQCDKSDGAIPVVSANCTLGWVGNADSGDQSKRNIGTIQSKLTTSQRTNDPRSSLWDVAAAVRCRDGKSRRIEPSTCPVAHGIPGRVGLLRGYGNAIVPQTAAEFIMACDKILTANA